MNDNGLIGFCVVLAMLLVGWAIYESFEEARLCEKAGGHQNTKWGGGFTSNGDYAAASVTFCISADGRILR